MQRKNIHESRYASSLIEASLDPLFTISKEGKIMDMNEASNIIFLINGINKSGIFKATVSEDQDTKKYPAQLVRPKAGSVHWYLDETVVSRLTDL
jgi:hypothetical protein